MIKKPGKLKFAGLFYYNLSWLRLFERFEFRCKWSNAHVVNIQLEMSNNLRSEYQTETQSISNNQK
jgi:hypothetical protein